MTRENIDKKALRIAGELWEDRKRLATQYDELREVALKFPVGSFERIDLLTLATWSWRLSLPPP